jgi:nucleotide-binding universal stress UspA family protein
VSVVVAVDGSEAAIRAARAGLELLGMPPDAVIVTVIEVGDPMAVVGTGMAGGTMSPDEYDALQQAQSEAGTHVVDEAAAALGMRDAPRRVLRGDPAITLCEAAAELSARAIVIGTRGRGGIKRALMGSVSDHVVRNASCPVVVTAEHDGEGDA